MVRLPRESRCLRELLRKLGDCDEGTQAMVPGAGETISGLQRRPVGHNGFGLGSWIRGMRRAAPCPFCQRKRCAFFERSEKNTRKAPGENTASWMFSIRLKTGTTRT